MSRHSLRLCIDRLESRIAPAVSAVGGELAVNSYTTGTQRFPAIGTDADGDFAVVWESVGQDGDSIGVFARRYSAAGSPLGTETLVNTYTTSSQATPVIAMDADGDFVVVWKSLNQDGDGYGIFAQRFRASGSPIGQEFQVNQFTTGSQDSPAVASDADGNLVIVWESPGQDGNADGIYARRFGADGAALGPEFQVNGFTAGGQRAPAVAMNPNGAFVVTWMSAGQDGDGYGIYAQRYTSAGAALSTEFRVNTFTALGQTGPSIALDAAGDFVIVWVSDRQEGASFAYGVYAQRFSAAGVADGGEFHVNTVTSGNQSNPSVARAAGGAFVVAFQSDGPGQDGSASGIYVRLYTAAGVEIGPDVRVNTHVTGAQNNVAVACDAEGDFVVAWSGVAAADTAGVSAQRYDESVDAAAPWIVDVFPANSLDPIRQGERAAAPPTALLASASEDLSITGGAIGVNSATNPANWALTRNGVGVPITGVIYGFNPVTRRFEAKLNLSAPLGDGNYLLTPQPALRDATGNALDGDRDGIPGGSFTRSFRVAVPVAIGPEFRLNEVTTLSQSGSAIAIDGDGDFILAWTGYDQDSFGVFARRYRADGTPLSGEFRVNTTTTALQYSPKVAAARNGDFVIAWQNFTGTANDVRLQRYLANGAPVGSEFSAVNSTGVAPQHPALAMDEAGNFIVAWDGDGNDPSGFGVGARRFAANGTPLGNEFRVNTYTTGAQDGPAIAADRQGNFVIVWYSNNQDGDGFGIYGQRYNAAGTPLGGEFAVNAFTTRQQIVSSVAADADGNFVIVWQSENQDGSDNGIYAQRYSAAGVPLPRPPGAIPGLGPNEFRINSWTSQSQSLPTVSADADGDFVITWSSYLQDGSQSGIYAQRFDSGGEPYGGEFRVNTLTTNAQYLSATASDADGDFIVTWTSRGQEGDSSDGVFAQRFGVPPPRVIGMQVNDGTSQRSRVTSLQITLSTEVTFATTAAAAFTLTRNGGGAVTFQATPGIVGGVTVVTLNAFTGVETETGSLRDGRYTLTVVADQISDTFGQALDGNSDGTAGDNVIFGDPQGLYRFYGDINGDRRVDIADFAVFSPAFLQGPGANNPALDFNGDGRIDIADFAQFSVRYFTTLP